MPTEYDDLDDLLDDDELQASILNKAPGAAANEVQGGKHTEPDLSKLHLNSEDDKSTSNATTSAPKAKKDEPQIDESGLESLLQSLENGGDPDAALRTLLGQLNQQPAPEYTDKSAFGAGSNGGSFEDTISATMDRLQKSQKPGTNDANDTDVLAQLLKELQGDPSLGEGASVNGLDGILGNLLNELATKDVLYEPLKELHNNYPDWLAKNAASLDSKELTRLKTQQNIVAAVVAKFELPDYSDQNTAYREFITEKMAEMQETGAPPPELVGDVAGGAFPVPGMGANPPPDLPSDCATQ